MRVVHAGYKTEAMNSPRSTNMSQGTAAPLVSVLILAYNNDLYIRNALRGVFSQVCSFEYEVLIGEDASTDTTNGVILQVLAEHPDRAVLHTRPVNVGMHKNYDDLLRRARGKYVADLDGDDVWIDPTKLQKQLELMERESDVAVVFTRSETVDANGVPLNSDSPYMRLREILTFAEVFSRCDIPHSSIMFRRALLEELPVWTFGLPNYDWSMFVCLAAKGRVVGLPDISTRYTWHGFGSASGRSASGHLRANYQQYVTHARLFRNSIDSMAKRSARQAFESTVSWALSAAASASERIFVGLTYLKFCFAIRCKPSLPWLAGEIRKGLRARAR